MIVVLTGSNSFLLKAELKKITQEFVKKYGDFGLERTEAAEIDLGRLLENVSSLPFLAPRRMIILSDPSSNKVLADNVDKLLDSVADTTDLVIVEPKFDKRLSLYKTLKKRADMRDFVELDERSLPNWLVSAAKARGGELSSTDASYLVQRIGGGQMNASSELDKLITYEPKITRDTIDLLTEQAPQSTVFDLLEAVFRGNKKIAMQLYEEQRSQQVEPQAIMGMIAWQVHILAIIKANEKLGADTIAARAKISPFVVRKTMYLTHSQSMRDIKDLVKKVLDLDIRLKSEAIDADEALKHLLLTI